MNYIKRMNNLRKKMKNADLDGFIILDRSNTFYFSGFQGTSSIIILMSDVALFLTDSRYYDHAKKSLPPFFEVLLQKNDGRDQIKSFFSARGKLHIGFEPSISYAKHKWLLRAVKPARLLEAGNIISAQRDIKDETEIKNIRKAASITDRCFRMVCKNIKPGMTERQIAINIKRFFEDSGAEGESFPTIVASGPNAAMPHHRSSKRKFKKGDVVLLDMGCRIAGYCSDLSRTIFLGSVSEPEKEIYKIVQQAQKIGVNAVRPGISAKELDGLVRQSITDAGYGESFGHNTGHGVGIEIHESPLIGPLSDIILKKGMILTIEPGIYCPGFSGVGIEDMVLVTGEGGKLLSRCSRKLLVTGG